MMRSMFSGVSGLRVHQTKMDVIGNNIANVNTVGFKSSRVTFNEVFSQTLSGASGANSSTGRAGTNPMQIGLGSNVSTIDKLMTTGAAQRTDNPTDLMISGSGFFIVSDSSGQYYTRAGNFTEDAQGNLTYNGLKLMGWDTMWDDTSKDYRIKKATVQPIVIGGDKNYIDPTSTTQVNFAGNLSENETPIEKNITMFDTIGNSYTLKMIFNYSATEDNSDPDNVIPAGWSYTFDTKLYQTGSTKSYDIAVTTEGSNALTFDRFGNLATGTPKTVTIDLSGVTLEPAAQFGTITYNSTTGKPESANNKVILNFADLTQHGNETTTAKAQNADGNAPGTRENLSIASDGKIYGLYSNGMTKLLGQIAIASFRNPSGLEAIGNNLFVPTANSGDFDGTGDEGTMLGGVLEMANVDLASEFTEMITTQRGFQANSRIITTSDDMLQELVNLKR